MRHNVFISYHNAMDQDYRNKFESYFASRFDVLISKSVQIGEIDPNFKTDTIRQKIRDEYLRDSTVTVVLVGRATWQRKHVDWEIGSSIRQTEYNSRSGLLGIFLPSYPLMADNKFNPFTIPPRLYYNWKCGYAKLYNWSSDPAQLSNWIQEAFDNRGKLEPDNSYPSFTNNHSGDRWYE